MFDKMDTTNVLENAVMEFHTAPNMLPIQVVDANERFGILHIKTRKVGILQVPTFILFTLDRTGSMKESSEDGMTNMEYVKQTMKNIVHYISNQPANIIIQINIFNDTVDVLLPPTEITRENVDGICEQISQIEPSGITNIGVALQSASQTLTSYLATYPSHNVAHIFMTDGEPTDGVCEANMLTSYVNTSYPNINIGFGHRHNVILMRKLSELDRGYYNFVDNVKNTSMVYGEIMHMLLYPAMKNMELTAESGIIYNWRNNTWGCSFKEPVLVGDATKTYHIKTTDKENMHVKLTGDPVEVDGPPILEYIDCIPDLIDESGEISAHSNLIQYAYRQQVQELVFEGRTDTNADKTEYKSKLLNLFHIIREYMKTQALTEDPFLCQLCDDLSITYQTCTSELGVLYATARSITQGSQQSYTPKLPKLNIRRGFAQGIPRPPRLIRRTNMDTVFSMDATVVPDTEIDLYQSIRENTSCYASPSAIQALRSLDSP
jgi:uncharacterized protein YegL